MSRLTPSSYPQLISHSARNRPMLWNTNASERTRLKRHPWYVCKGSSSRLPTRKNITGPVPLGGVREREKSLQRSSGRPPNSRGRITRSYAGVVQISATSPGYQLTIFWTLEPSPPPLGNGSSRYLRVPKVLEVGNYLQAR
jgi:hypothetical protein